MRTGKQKEWLGFWFMSLVLSSVVVAQTAGLPPRPIDTFNTQVQRFDLVELAGGFDHPWGLAFLPGGQLLVTERPGSLYLLTPQANGGFSRQKVAGVPRVHAGGQGGLLDVAIDPDFSANQLVYLTWAKTGPGGSGTAIGRGRLVGTTLADFTVLWELARKSSASVHFGSRMVFAPDGTLLFNVSDRGEQRRAQDFQDPAGSVIRLYRDGSIPADNPARGRTTWLPELWSVGHRNIQGIVYDGEGRLWATEHGPRGGDELNQILPGKNYGWPLVTHGINYNGSSISPHQSLPGYQDPLIVWTPSIAPSGLAWLPPDSPFVAWRGNLLSGNLAGQELKRIVLKGETVIAQESLLLRTIGRIRDVRVGPDGLVYLLTDASPGSLYRLEISP